MSGIPFGLLDIYYKDLNFSNIEPGIAFFGINRAEFQIE